MLGSGNLEITHRVHGIPFHRIGECKRCGSCCGVCEYLNEDGSCLTYPECPAYNNDLRERFPDHPWLRVIREGVCGYQFVRLTEEGERDDTPLPFTS